MVCITLGHLEVELPALQMVDTITFNNQGFTFENYLDKAKKSYRKKFGVGIVPCLQKYIKGGSIIYVKYCRRCHAWTTGNYLKKRKRGEHIIGYDTSKK